MHAPMKLSPQSSNKYMHHLRKFLCAPLFVVRTLIMRSTLLMKSWVLNTVLLTIGTMLYRRYLESFTYQTETLYPLENNFSFGFSSFFQFSE